MLFVENIKLALFAIRANKMRSFLTMLGIIIGISSVISITSIGASAQAIITKEFENFEDGYMIIMLNWRLLDSGDIDRFRYDDFLGRDEIEALKNRFPDDIRYAEMFSAGNSSDTKVGRVEGRLAFHGVGANYNEFDKGIKILHGRMIDKNDVNAGRENIVIDVEAARHFFNRENVVGRTLPATIRGSATDLTIVGVFERPPSIFTGLMMGTSFESYVPVTLMMARDDKSFYIEVVANPDKDVAKQGQAFVNYLNRIKGKENLYMFETLESQLSIVNTVLGTLSAALGAIAGISLLVGGIGIMNIMLVSVTERTREIGVRKSLGARTRDILTQFLIEAMILSGIGGMIGTTIGITFVGLGLMAFGITVVIQPLVIVFTVIFSAAVGMFFGIYPARKAAKLDPIEALRYE
jgi:putative ABC transport system permease protein